MTEAVRVRFAPSPTGMFHIGSARTALFNWLYARHTQGTFILRVEDTDAARNQPEFVQVIFRSLEWLGLNWDEGPRPDGSTSGEYGPYFQSQRGEIYKRYIKQLLDAGQAYEQDGAIKFRVPKTPITVTDVICGEHIHDRTNEPDLVIARKDGSPVFHLVNVVDDIEMKITHVIRGEDHLSNTHKHLALFEAFGVKPPAYCHIPLILNKHDGSKMAKRNEGAAVQGYIEGGYLPEAVRNYLCLLGWSPKDNREIITIEEVVKIFELNQINRSNARFDRDKLYWINGEYFRNSTVEHLEPLARKMLAQKEIATNHVDPDYFRAALAIVKEKIKLGREFPEWMSYFFSETFEYDADAVKKLFNHQGKTNLKLILDTVKDWPAEKAFLAADIEDKFKTIAAATSQKVGAFVHPVRLSVSGRTVGPSLYHLLEVLGKNRVSTRLNRAIDSIETATP